MAACSSPVTSASKRSSKNKNLITKTNTKKKKKRIDSDATQEPPISSTSSPSSSHTPRKNSRPVVRVMKGNRIYDSENGKCCHQCRQKTLDFVATCKNLTENKQCTLHFCHKCLFNRYGEKAEEAVVLGNWICPKCRGICNCSYCMKKRGCAPTGILAHTAKANGFSSVSDMLHLKASKSSSTEKDIVSVVKIPLPQGTELNNVAAVGMHAKDVGHALQFLEFCEAFGKVLNLNKGQPESVLRDLVCGRSRRRMEDSAVVQFHIQLLSIIQKHSGKEYPSSWLQALNKCISESYYLLKELQLDSFDVDGGGYDELDSSKKLRLLNFLCDEALGTEVLRSWIDEQNSKYITREKNVKGEVLSAEKSMKNKMQDEVIQALLAKNGHPLSIAEHEDLVSKIKTEVAHTLTQSVEAADTVPKKEHRSDAVRSDPIVSDENGRKFWKLRSYSSEMDILLQDLGEDSVAAEDRWFTYDVEQRTMVDNYISSFRKLRK